MEESNYIREAYFSFGKDYCKIYIQPSFAVILQIGDIIDLTKDDIEYSYWFYKSDNDKEVCFDEIRNKKLVVKSRVIENNIIIIKVDII